MITDAIVTVLLVIPNLIVSALPAAASHTWIAGLDLTVLSAGFTFNAILPLAEVVAVATVVVGLSWATITFNLGVYIYRLVHPFK